MPAMSEHIATIFWNRNQEAFIDNRYSREHTWTFDGGVEVPASASPQVVRIPYSNPACVDPEEAFVAALSSCHMLCFLSIAAQKQCIIESYRDRAVGILGKNEAGKRAIVQVRLNPQVTLSGDNLPQPEDLEMMHDEAHHACFLANSVKTEIIVDLP
jgi:organic hydroperoxide reductase OsmC/OhrA